MVHSTSGPKLAIAYGEDAGTEERGDVEVEGGEREERVEEGREVVGEVCETKDTTDGLGDGAEEVAEGEGHGGWRLERGRGDVHGVMYILVAGV